jgi:hypothetical protein
MLRGGSTAVARHLESVDVDRIFLYEENPRHEPIETEPEIIAYLTNDEQVYNLARSISEIGPNPLELLGIVQIPGSGAAATKKSYQAWEGNRRLCAIKLLNDPDLAPPHLRKDFERIAKEAEFPLPIKKINCVVFDDHDDLKIWMGIIHNGAQAGVGRLDWDAQQKARHFGSSRNRVALAVLDTAEAMGLITKDEREGKLTTAQRFLGRSVVREAIGLDASNPDDVTYNRPLDDFQKQLTIFINDLREGTRVTSRHNQAQIDAYGRKLARNADITNERIEPQTLKAAAKAKVKRKKAAKQPRRLIHLEYEKELATALEAIRSSKLESLYYSICEVRIQHAPLLTIGLWAFIESLTALAGKKDNVDFVAFCSNERMATCGFNKTKAGPIRQALTRIQSNGNATKHHEIAASFDGQQLANDLATITPLLIKIAESTAPKK